MNVFFLCFGIHFVVKVFGIFVCALLFFVGTRKNTLFERTKLMFCHLSLSPLFSLSRALKSHFLVHTLLTVARESTLCVLNCISTFETKAIKSDLKRTNSFSQRCVHFFSSFTSTPAWFSRSASYLCTTFLVLVSKLHSIIWNYTVNGVGIPQTRSLSSFILHTMHVQSCEIMMKRKENALKNWPQLDKPRFSLAIWTMYRFKRLCAKQRKF